MLKKPKTQQYKLDFAKQYQRNRRRDPIYREEQRLYHETRRKDPAFRELARLYQEEKRKEEGRPSRKHLHLMYTNDFVLKSSITHNKKYDYTLVKYVNSQTKVIIVCPTHGKFLQTPTAHLSGQGCPSCASIVRREKCGITRRTTEQFIQEAQVIHNCQYAYTQAIYHNLNTKVIITCPEHGEFLQTPKAHLRGQGCPMCANEKRLAFFQSEGEKLIEQYLISNQIIYEPQKMFEDCVYKQMLRYDFYLPYKNVLIEFDGRQHFEFTKKYHKTVEFFEIFQKRDNIKNKYAEENHIPLIRIRYDEQHLIPTILSTKL